MLIMQNYNTIIGLIQMRQNECSIRVIRERYHIGNGTVQLILNRFNASGFSLEQLNEYSGVNSITSPAFGNHHSV